MTLHTLAWITFILALMNEVRGLYEEREWTAPRVLLGIPFTIAFWALIVWVVFYL